MLSMNKFVPAWVLLLILLLGALFSLFFGWSIVRTLDDNKGGRFGKMAVEIASFPTLAKSVFDDLSVDLFNKDYLIRVPGSRENLSEYTQIKSNAGVDVSGLIVHADKSALSRAPGWRILVGAFTINGELKNAALALSPELSIEKVWILTEQEINGTKPRAPHRKFIHGFDILKDGSVIFSFDGGMSLQRFDQCSTPVWAIDGNFHHAVSLTEDEKYVWTLLDGGKVVKVSTATSEISRQFTMQEIIAANPQIDILEIRKHLDSDLGGNSRNTHGNWLKDHFHLNDVDPLPASLVDRFDGFEAGDLLVSARSLNLVFVVDPDTLIVKWWRIGATRRQHDPDWSHTGEITVFDNRMGRDFSQIVSLSPTSYTTKVLHDGRKNNFYSRIRGKHQITRDGNLLITSSQQGRVFELGANGKIILDIHNTKPGNDEFNFVLSQAIWLPLDTFNFQEDKSCKN